MNNVINDTPILKVENDRLGFKPYVETIYEIITSENNFTPLTLGIYGSWGAGKTTMMRMVESLLHTTTIKMPVVWFDAWKYNKEDSIWRSLIISILDVINHDPSKAKDVDEENKDVYASLYRSFEKEEVGKIEFDWAKVVRGSGKLVMRFILGTVLPGVNKAFDKFKRESISNDLDFLFDTIKRKKIKVHKEHIKSIEQFHDNFRKVINSYFTKLNSTKRLVIFIDDLDRCLPDKAVEVLEAIKLFFDVPNVIFIIGMDNEIIERLVENKYGFLGNKTTFENDKAIDQKIFDGKIYIEKIVQIPIQLPPINKNVLDEYIRSIVPGNWPDDLCEKVFAEAYEDNNPRRVKRLINSFFILWSIAKNMNMNLSPVILAKIVAIQHTDSDFYNHIKKSPSFLRELEIYYKTPIGDVEGGQVHPLQKIIDQYYAKKGHVVKRILLVSPNKDMSFEPLNDNSISDYFAISNVINIPDNTDSRKNFILEPQLIKIPEGAFLMGSSEDDLLGQIIEKPQHSVWLGAFEISKTPITNFEYSSFIKNTNYIPPSDWINRDFPDGKADYPVTYVSWEDANKYCEWLKEKTGKNYCLPTEAQWEKAARGTDGNIYPWGNEWDENKLNSLEHKIDSTTIVGRFSAVGDSPYGLVDVSGNVWEWCWDWYDDKEFENRTKTGNPIVDPNGPSTGSYKILKGGSFRNPKLNARCAFKLRDGIYSKSSGFGFRVALL